MSPDQQPVKEDGPREDFEATEASSSPADPMDPGHPSPGSESEGIPSTSIIDEHGREISSEGQRETKRKGLPEQSWRSV